MKHAGTLLLYTTCFAVMLAGSVYFFRQGGKRHVPLGLLFVLVAIGILWAIYITYQKHRQELIQSQRRNYIIRQSNTRPVLPLYNSPSNNATDQGNGAATSNTPRKPNIFQMRFDPSTKLRPPPRAVVRQSQQEPQINQLTGRSAVEGKCYSALGSYHLGSD